MENKTHSKVLGNYIQITVDPEDITVNVTIRIYYTPEQLSTLGLDENSLRICHWDEVANDWITHRHEGKYHRTLRLGNGWSSQHMGPHGTTATVLDSNVVPSFD